MPAQVSNPKTAYYGKSDTAPDLRNRLDDGDGNPIDLTGATVVINIAYGTSPFYYRPTLRIVDGGACVPDADQVTNKGYVDWTPLAGELEPAGQFLYQYVITYSGGGVQTIPAFTWLPMVILTPVGGNGGPP